MAVGRTNERTRKERINTEDRKNEINKEITHERTDGMGERTVGKLRDAPIRLKKTMANERKRKDTKRK